MLDNATASATATIISMRKRHDTNTSKGKLKQRKGNFVLDCCNLEVTIPHYESARDRNLQFYFQKTRLKKRLIELNKIAKADCSRSRIEDPTKKEKTDRAWIKNILSFQEKQVKQLSKKVVNRNSSLRKTITNTTNVILPELMSTQRSKQHLENIIKSFEFKSVTHKKPKIEAENPLHPITKQEFLLTITKYKNKP